MLKLIKAIQLRSLFVLTVVLLPAVTVLSADYLSVSRSATIKERPDRDAEILARSDRGDMLSLLSETQRNGYYEVLVPGSNRPGWIYRTLVRRHRGDLEIVEPEGPTIDTDPAARPDRALTIGSFNIQFLGSSTRRDNAALVNLVSGYDVVVVQELVAPPYPGTFPDGTAFNPDVEAQAFFDLMRSAGFDFILSEEDTGTADSNHNNGPATEWWAAFYKPDAVTVPDNLPSGFLATDRTNHPDYERVPFAFPFRSTNGQLDFVLVSVHLKPGDSGSDMSRRAVELSAINDWIQTNDDVEKDFIVLGDMNFKNCEEIGAGVPSGLSSLNEACLPTNTNINGPRPYDNVLYHEESTTELDGGFGFVVVDLIEQMRDDWDMAQGDYPGEPYKHNLFRKFYSDHHPVVFQLLIPDDDDD